MRIRDGKNLDPGWKKFGSGIGKNIPDPQHGFTGTLSEKQCSGSGTFWYRSGSVNPYLCLTDLDPPPDHALFDSDLLDANKKYKFFHLLLFEGTFIIILHRKKS
jgi:hypothetical protein